MEFVSRGTSLLAITASAGPVGTGPETMGGVPRQARVAERVEEGGAEMEISIWEEAVPGEEKRRLVTYTAGRQHIGLVSRDSAGRVTAGERARLRLVLAEDGNVRGILL